jgi:hypothetical protein
MLVLRIDIDASYKHPETVRGWLTQRRMRTWTLIVYIKVVVSWVRRALRISSTSNFKKVLAKIIKQLKNHFLLV